MCVHHHRKAAGVVCLACILAGVAHEGAPSPSAALCEGVIQIENGIPIRDLGVPEGCGDGAPHSRDVRVTSLSTSTGTLSMTGSAVISQIIAMDENVPEPIDRRFATSTFVVPLISGSTANVDQATPLFVVADGTTRRVR